MSKSDPAKQNDRRQRAFAAAFGVWLALALLKMGAPVILDDKTTAPGDLLEVLIFSWPVRWGYLLLLPAIFLALPLIRWSLPRPRWITLLPLVWLGWQMLSATQSVDPDLTQETLWHFGACVTAFYLGSLALSQMRDSRWFWTALVGAFALVLAVGWHQRFIGLEETRRYFYEQPNWREYPPEFLKKVASNRIYATLFYPNAFAGVILLLTPVWVSMLWRSSRGWIRGARIALVAAGGILSVGCLVWSGSKAGWLIFIGIGALALLHSPVSRRWKTFVLVAAVTAGLAGFLMRYSGYLTAGASSVRARIGYWKAAVTLTLERPILGSGPGTFMVGYKRLKAPEDEMSRLAHNDYLQQAADSGIPGFLLFSGLVFAPLIVSFRRTPSDYLGTGFAVWLGLVALAIQSCVEFGLYIPAISWTFFALLGWLWGQTARGNPLDNPQSSRYGPSQR